MIHFTKMHGLGNDFVVINNTNQNIKFNQDLIKFISDRHTGIGCDQVLVLEKSNQADIDFNYRIFNSDGSEVGQCGNGARCLAKFIVDNKLAKNSFRVKTQTRVLDLCYESPDNITVNMGVPEKFKKIKVNNHSGIQLWLGNPHRVFYDYDFKNNSSHKINVKNYNMGFAKIINNHTIKLRVFERGVGETLACGSGACAAVVAGIIQQKLYPDQPITVTLPRGNLMISWKGKGHPVMMTGPAVTVYTGQLIYL